MENEPSNTTVHDAVSAAGMEGSKVDGSWSGFADDLFIKDEISDHTVETAKDIILNNASTLDETLAEDRYKQNLRKLEIVSSIRRHGEQRRLTSGKILGEASQRDIHSTGAPERKSIAG